MCTETPTLNDMGDELIVTGIVYIMVFIAIILNIFGVYCLHKTKKVGKNQQIILTNLNVVRMFALPMFCLETYFTLLAPFSRPKYYVIINVYIDFLVICLIIFSMSLISVDRLLCVALCLKYKVHVTKGRLIKGVVFIWVFSFPLSFLAYFPPYSLYLLKFIGCCFLFITVVTYSTIAYKLQKRTREFASAVNTANTERNPFRKHYIIPFLIVICFVILGVIPFDLRLLMKYSKLLDLVQSPIISINYIVDPLIYLFLQRDVRKTALDTLRCFRGCRSNSRIEANQNRSKHEVYTSSSNENEANNSTSL